MVGWLGWDSKQACAPIIGTIQPTTTPKIFSFHHTMWFVDSPLIIYFDIWGPHYFYILIDPSSCLSMWDPYVILLEAWSISMKVIANHVLQRKKKKRKERFIALNLWVMSIIRFCNVRPAKWLDPSSLVSVIIEIFWVV